MKSLRRGIEFFLLKLLAAFLASLPERTSLHCGRILGISIFHLMGHRKEVAYKNISLCSIGSSRKLQSKILRRCLENFGMTAVEFLRQNIYSDDDYRRKVVIKDFSAFDKAFEKHHGVFLLSGHYDNWELLIQGIAAYGYKTTMLVRQQHNLKVDDLINSIRRNERMDVIIAESSPRNILRALKREYGVATLLDIWGGKDGRMANFFGHQISTPSGVVEIALRQKVPILVGFLERLRNGAHRLEHVEVIFPGEDERFSDVNSVLEYYHRSLEEAIKKRPFLWLWTHRRFKNIVDY
jgi:KDO2-lipid IV(A) lauroyltransferase